MMPGGFEKATTFDGFQQVKTGSSVVVLRMPGPYKEVTAGFDQAHLAAQGMRLKTKGPVTVDGQAGMLLRLTQQARGIDFAKWIVTFGDEKQTFLITATFPEARTELSPRMKASVLSVRREKTPVGTSAPTDPGAGIPYTLTSSDKLKLAGTMGKALFYTRDGAIPIKSPGDPIFVVAPSMGDAAPLGDRKEIALQRLQQTKVTKDISVTTNEPVTIDGLSGYEITATATDAKTNGPLTVYQVMLFDEKSYILMQGMVETPQGEAYLAEFKAAARTFKRKKP
jgi:hypothetical protein